MSFALMLKDQTSSGDLLAETVIRFPAEQVTVQQLIETRVRREVESWNADADGEYKGLVELTEDEVLLNGPKNRPGHMLDAGHQIARAIEAFEKSHFFLLVNDRQLTELDEKIVITPKTKVVFLRLVRLVGG